MSKVLAFAAFVALALPQLAEAQAKTLYVINGTASGSNFGALQDGGTAPTTATLVTGWITNRGNVGTMSPLDWGVKQADTTFGLTAIPDGTPDNATGDALRTQNAYTGTFANTAWTISQSVIATVANTNTMRLRYRVLASTDPTGATGMRELTSAPQVTGSTTVSLTTTTAQNLSVTWSPGATITLNSEYLFFQIACEITLKGSNGATQDIVLRTDATNSRITTPVFTAATLVTSVAVNPTTATILAGGTQAISATALPAGATNRNVNWTKGAGCDASDAVSPASTLGNGVATTTFTAGTSGTFPRSCAVTATAADGSGFSATSTITVNPAPVTSVSVNPTTATILAGGTRTISATALPAGATNRNVNWTKISGCDAADTLNPASTLGDGAATTTFTASTGGTLPRSCVVRATAADGSGFNASTTITVNPVPVTGVAIAPTSATVNTGGTRQFTATVSPANATNPSVTWSVLGGASCGSVNGTGLYTAPATAAAGCSVRVTTADGGFTSDAPITLNKPVTGVAISPTSATVNTGATQQFTPSVSPSDASNPSVTWSVLGGASCGSVNGSGLYTAPAAVAAGCSVRVTTVDGGFTSDAPITLNKPVTAVAISPTSATVNTGATQQFTPTVSPSDASNTSVTWSVLGGASCGSVNGAGLYTAPASVAAGCSVRVTTVDGGFTADAAVTLNKPVTGVAISPASATVTVNATQQFTPTVSPADASNTSVTWSVLGGASCGSVNATGLYTAPASVASGCAVRVTSVEGGFTADAGVTLQTAVVPVTGVAIAPTSATVNTGATQQFTATVSPAGATNKSVTWSVVQGASCGSVNATGLYTAPANVASPCTVRVTTVDGAKTADATVTLHKPVSGVAIAPTSATVTVNGTQQFTATISPSDASNKTVSWSVVGTSCGTVSTTGLYTAPAAATSGCSVQVTTQEGPFSASAPVTLQAAYVAVTGVSILPASATVNTGAQQQFTATVAPSDASNKSVTWSVVGASCGSVDGTGLYTAPANVASGCSVRVTTQEGSYTANATLTLRKPVTAVAIAPASATVSLNQTQQFTATVSPADASNKAVSWSVVGSGCGSVSGTGLYTAPAALAASCSVRVTTADGGYTANAPVSLISGPTTIVADLASPPSGTVAPQTPARAVDAFTLQTNVGTDAVSSATVTLASGTWVGIAAVSIQNTDACTQATPYGSIAPASNQVVIPLTGVTATGSATTYYVCIAPKAHSAMPVPAGAEYAVTATVTSIASAATYTKSYGDLASATITIDNKSPGNVVWGAITPTAGKVTLSWTAPSADADFSTVVVLRNTGAPVVDAPPEGASPSTGTILPNSVVVCAQPAGPCEDSPLVDGKAYYYKAFAKDQYGNYAVGVAAGPAFPGANPFPVGSADPARPMVAIVNPGNGAVVSGGTTQAFRVQVRVWSPGALVTGVRVTADAGASWTTLGQSTQYAGTPDVSGVWEKELTLAEGSYSLVAQAKNDAATWINSAPVGIVVKAKNTGDGRLLVRDNASQLCADCHAHKAHSSETLGTTYGSWATVCRDCHTPHGTTNIYLVPTQITPPPIGAAVPAPKDVVFTSPTVLENPSKTGPCQVCHTQTKFYRADGTSPGGAHDTGDCASCHKHADGLKASCTDCHGTKGRTANVVGADSNLASAPPDLAHEPTDPLKTPTATGAVANGAHLGHLDKNDFRAAPLQCAACHLTKSHQDGAADVAWGPLANAGGAFSPTPATGPVGAGFSTTPTCTTWCHGGGLAGGGRGLTWAWNGTGPLACNSCHGQSSVAMPAQAAAHHPQNSTCASCHGVDYTTGSKANHIDGTVQHPTGCRACHGKLVGLGGGVATNTDAAAAPGYDGTAVDTKGNVARTFVGVGAHGTHVSGGTMMSPKCGECHQIPGDGNVAHADAAYAWSWTAIEGVTPSYTAPSCTNYCHSNARPLGQASATTVGMTWTSTTALGCADCHKTAAGGAADLSARHGKHLAYAFTCDECHAVTMADNSSGTIGTRGYHVNGAKNVDFSSTALAVQIAQQGGGYVGYACSSTYCHSDGTATSAPFGAPVGTALSWLDGTTSLKCDNCHGGNASADHVLATGSHTGHVNEASYLGTNLGCVTCHANTVSGDRAIGTAANHVNGLHDVSAGGWDGASTCGTNYCHSNGTENLAAGDYKPVTWGVTALANDCKGCHGTETGSIAGAPWYANDTGSFKTRNSHKKHVTAATDCVKCHAGTVQPSGALVANGTKHLDLSRDVSGAGIGSYDEANERCSAVTCHGGANPVWGDTLTCASCHSGTEGGALADGTPNGVNAEWATRGHGSASGGALTSALNGCDYCHQLDSAHTPTTGANPYRLRFSATDNSLCLQCHLNGSAGIGANSDGTALASKNGVAVDAAHDGVKHAPTEGGMFCWDCHDPHGVPTNIRMVKQSVSKTSDAHGVPTSTATVVFTDNTTVGVGTGRFVEGTNNPRQGICQACHDPGKPGTESSKYWRWDGTDDEDGAGGNAPVASGHNSGQLCSDCHEHKTKFAGKGACSACHLAPSGAGDQDEDDVAYVYNNNVKAVIDSDDWAISGHGRPAASGNYESNNLPAAFPVTATVEGCYYCHAPDTALPGGTGQTSTHDQINSGANPYRLANTNWLTKGKNGVCLVCHDTVDATGFDPDGTTGSVFTDAKLASKRIDAAHYGAGHTAAGTDAGMFCWDCHDPHGDYSSVGLRPIAYMIHSKPTKDHSGAAGFGVPTARATAVDFAKAGGFDGGAFDGGDYVDTNSASGYNGVCQVCHGTTKFWTSTGGGTTHQNGTARCVSCHAHDQGTVDAFLNVPATSCNTCHPSLPSGGRHAIHLGTVPPTTYGDAAIGSTPTEYRFGCGKCHGATAANHMDDQGGTAGDPYRVDYAFDLGGTYAPGSGTVYQENGTGTTPNLWFGYQDGSCSSTYCHDPLGASYAIGAGQKQAVSWNVAGTLGCTGCHDDGASTTTALPGTHGRHVLPYANDGYQYGCEKCHDDTVSNSSTLRTTAGQGKVKHVNGNRADLKFNGSPIDQTQGTSYSGGTGGTCANTYCHSDGKSLTAPFTSTSTAWGSTAATRCLGCHGGGNAATTTLAGSHGKHVRTYAGDGYQYDCDRCHNATGNGTTITNRANHVDADATHDVAFNNTGGIDNTQGTSYATAGQTCANTYCHSDGKDVAAPFTSTSTQWGVTPTTPCLRCHDGGNGASATLLSSRHGIHVDSNANGGYAYGCERCHVNTVSSSTVISNRANHVNMNTTTHDVAFNNNGTIDNTQGTSYNATAQTCANTYCHSNGVDRAAPFTTTSVAWTAGLSCGNCHAAGSAMATQSHGIHVNNTAYTGNFGCISCHDTVSNDTTIDPAKLGQHVNLVAETTGTSFSGGICASNTCHSNGTERPLVAADYKSVTWGGTDTTDGCKECHGSEATAPAFTSAYGEPNYASSSGRYLNSHKAHVTYTDVNVAKTQCVKCHSGTVDATGAILSNGTHLDLANNVRDVANGGGATFTWNDGTESCSAISCHGGGTATWGGTLDCSGCHTGAVSATTDTEVDDYNYDTAPLAKIDPEDWITTGHGRPTGSNYDSGNGPAAFDTAIGVTTDDGCKWCHDKNVPHGQFGTSSNPFRLANIGAGNTAALKNGVCTICHGGTGYTIGATTKDSTLDVDAGHHATRHSATVNGGELCWDCHDPHGDSRYTGNNATELPTVAANETLGHMIDAKLVKNHNSAEGNTTEWGVGGIQYGLSPVFRAGLSGGATTYEGTDYVVTTGNNNGVCQACHTNTSYWTAAVLGTQHQNGAAACTACHKHDQPTADAFLNVPATSCNTCHPSLPSGGRHAIHLGTVPPTTYGDAAIGSTPTEYRFGCGKCHGATAANHMDDQGGTAADPYRVDVAFDLGGTYPALAATVGTENGTGTTPNLWFGWQDGTCSSTYCHDPLGASYAIGAGQKQAVSWNVAGTLGCSGCHDDGASTTTALPGTHGRHVLPYANDGYQYGCEKCHDDTVSNSSTLRTTAGQGKVKHVNGNRADLKFNGSPIDQTQGTSYSGGTGGTCANTYCHSDGKSLTAPFTSTSTAWGSTAATRCLGCHGGGNSATTTLTASHGKHVLLDANGGYQYDCDRCHNNTGNGSTLTNRANHVDADATHDVAFNSLPVAATTATYDATGKTCSNTYCHSNGKSVTGPFTSPASAAWGTTPASPCLACHGGGNAASTTLSAQHGVHVNLNANGGYQYDCARCHVNTGTASLITNKANHVDADVTTHDVAFNNNGTIDNTQGTSYNATAQTCANTYCHSNGVDRVAPFTSTSVAWTAGLSCGNCHAAGSAMATQSHGIHVNNAAYTGNFGCISCHDTVSNDTTIDPAKYGQHVNLVAETTGTSFGGGVCASNTCHSNGTERPLVAADYKSVTWGGTDTTDGCKECHGSEATAPAFTSAYGEPNYASSSGRYLNSHKAHVTYSDVNVAKTECVLCHSGTVDGNGAILSNGTHLDLANNVRDVANGGGETFTWNDGTESCSAISCHGGGSATWGGTLDCSGCHMGAVSATTDTEVDNYNYKTAPMAMIDPEDWINYGHGRPSGNYDSGNGPAAFDAAIAVTTDDGCKYCHDKNVPHGQFGTSANPFRLANVGAGNTAALKNGVCTVCHGLTGDPNNGNGYLGKDAAKNIDARHYGVDHTAVTATFGGQLCWDCHDPHGDSRYSAANGGGAETPVVAANELLGHMIDAKLVRDHPTAEANTTEWGTNGTTGPTYAGKSPVFRAGLSGGATTYDWGDYAIAGTNYNGVCQVCHTKTTRFKADGTTWSQVTPGPDSGHNTGQGCTILCHTHDQPPTDAFKGKGTCLGCHASRTAGAIPRAAIMGADATTGGNDFIRASRHVSNGNTVTPIVKNVDCIICHEEGVKTSTETVVVTSTTYHGNDGGTTTVDLRNVDVSGGSGTPAVQWPGKRLASFTATTTQRNDLDTFCMNCHDAGGASNICVKADGTIETSTTGACSRRLTPFNPSDTLANGYDSAALNALRTRVIDVRSQFNSGNLQGKNFASHHNLNQFTKRYTTVNANWPATAWTAYVTKEGQTLNGATVRETAGLHCSDCHLNEANAHGTRNTWFMLASASISDATADAKFTTTGLPGGTDHCFRCHNSNAYGQAGTTSTTVPRTDAHDGDCPRIEGADVQGNMGAGLGMDVGGGTQHQLTCLMCHGGQGMGYIHGMNFTYKPVNGTNTSKTYRFQGGGGTWRWYSPISANPANATEAETMWEGNTSNYGCYTLGTGSAPADTYGGCTQHGIGGKTGNATNYARPLQY